MTQKIKNERKLANSSSAPMIQKQKKNIAIPELEVNLFNQIFITDGEDATQKFNQIFKGKSIVEPSNDNADQMDIDWVKAIPFQEEIFMDILSRLPVRSLLRFKCVSKFWGTLISEPYFKMKHLSRAKNDQDSQKLLICYMCPKDHIFSLYCCPLSSVQLVEDVPKIDCPSNPKSLCAIRCCYDGLIVIEVGGNLIVEPSTLLLWNPSTRESIVLPALKTPWTGFSCFGLGYDSTSGEYKILHIHQETGGCILSLKGGPWRRIDEHPRGIDSLLFAMQFLAFVHAAFHWIGISEDHAVVVLCSISNEVYGEIPLPEKMVGVGCTTIGISVLEGMLCVHSNSLHEWKDTIKLWVLKEYGVKESWIPLLTMENPSIFCAVPKYRFADGEVLFWCRLSQSSGRGFRTRSGPFVLWPRCDIYQDGYAFTESLISPKSLTY